MGKGINMQKIKVITLFSGIGSQEMALRNLGLDYEVVGISEIDKFAIKSYEAIHGRVHNFGDISKIDKLPYCDLLTYSFPCQDLSISGKQKGISKDTRSGLLLEVERLLLKAKENGTLPKYLLLENVKNLVGKKFIKDFERWLSFLNSLGYYSNWEVLNAKDYGIPQNRERVFVVSSLENIHYVFPKKQELKIKMKDLLEEHVPEKYYLSENYIKNFSDMTNRNGFVRGERFNPRELKECNVAFAITTRAGDRVTDNFIIQKNHGFNKGGIKENIVPTMTSSSWQENNFVVNINPNEDYRIRKLTPLEVWRLMGFSDTDFYAAKSIGTSNAQLYKQAGNSIVVTVLEAIFRQLFLKKHKKKQSIIAEQISLFQGAG